MDIKQAKENWAYARKALAEIHPSFKLHQGMPYDRVYVGFREDVNPLNMFGEYFKKALGSLSKRFEEIWFDFYNLDEFYARNLSFDLTHIDKELRRPITIKDKKERLEKLIVDGQNTTLIGVTARETGCIHERFEYEGEDVFKVYFSSGEEERLLKVEKLLEVGAELRGQRIIVDLCSDPVGQMLLAYDHPDDMVIPDPPDPKFLASLGKTFTEKPE